MWNTEIMKKIVGAKYLETCRKCLMHALIFLDMWTGSSNGRNGSDVIILCIKSEDHDTINESYIYDYV